MNEWIILYLEGAAIGQIFTRTAVIAVMWWHISKKTGSLYNETFTSDFAITRQQLHARNNTLSCC